MPGVQIEHTAVLDGTVQLESRRGGIWQGGRICIRRNAAIEVGVVLAPWMNGSIEIGESAFIGPYTVIYGEGGVTIGADSQVAGHCFIVASNHRFDDTSIPIKDQPSEARGIAIGRDVWIGAHCTILDGVELGDGCVIGAGSVVTRSIPPMSIAVGSPARVVRLRSKACAERSV